MNTDAILQGEKARLRPLTREDLPHFVRWLSDPEVTQYLALALHFQQSTLKDEERWLAEMAKRDDRTLWGIETLDGRLIGDINLTQLSLSNRNAELGILIGDKSCWDKGYGTDAIRTLLRHAFKDLSLHRVQLNTHEENKRAIRCYEKCGFVREGILREVRKEGNGRFVNAVLMSILDREFS